jgi:hypothetical protein
MTLLFDVRCAARIRNARLSDDRPIRQFVFAKAAEAYAIERLKKGSECPLNPELTSEQSDVDG